MAGLNLVPVILCTYPCRFHASMKVMSMYDIAEIYICTLTQASKYIWCIDKASYIMCIHDVSVCTYLWISAEGDIHLHDVHITQIQKVKYKYHAHILNASCVSISMHLLSMHDIYIFISCDWSIYTFTWCIQPRSRRSSMNIMPILNASCISMYLLYMHDISQYSFLVFIHMMQLSKCIECISIDRNNMSWKNGQPNTIDCKPWGWRGPRYVPTVALYR